MLPVGIIIFIVIYALVLCCYFYTETTGNLKLRAPNKILLALMFFVFGLCYAIKGAFDPFFTSLFIVALLLAALGDVFLLFSFSTGGHYFAAGNFAFIALQATILSTYRVTIGEIWWIFLLIPALWCIYPVLSHIYPNAFKFGKYKGPLFFYLATIIPSGTLGLALALFLPEFRLMGIGLVLFMLSDFDIVLHKFVFTENKWVHRLNSALYFVGMLLIVLNIAMFSL